jgi:glycine dehydrogenase subunit 1
MQEIGRTILQKSHYAAKRIAGIDGVEVLFGTPFFKEFVVSFENTGKSVSQVNKALLGQQIIGGKDISQEFPELGQSALYCVTEIMTKEDIDRLVFALETVTRES